MKVKEKREKTGLKLNIQKTKIMASGPIQFSSVQLSRLVVSEDHGIWSYSVQFSSVKSLSRVRLFVTPWIAAH